MRTVTILPPPFGLAITPPLLSAPTFHLHLRGRCLFVHALSLDHAQQALVQVGGPVNLDGLTVDDIEDVMAGDC